ncbi:MAG: ROK family transcriptional regulator [bacterium]|nr:ROK family transcriptional regulator [bacterium]
MQHKATRHDQRSQNLRLVLQCILGEGSISRADIARATGLTPATISQLVSQLERDGLVEELGTGPSAGGKPPTLYGVNAAARNIVVVDLSDSERVASVLDLKGTPSYQTTTTSDSLQGEEGIKALYRTIDDLTEQTPAPVLGIGIGTPGVVDSSGTVIEASYLDWHDVPLGALLSERYSLPVHVINNSRAAALAEYSYGEHEAENLLVVKVGNGVGAGVLLDGRIHGGEDSAAGEIGHVVVNPGGLPCYCGKTGCLETMAAAPRLVEALEPHLDTTSGTIRKIFSAAGAAAADGNEAIQEIINNTARNLATVLATTIAVLDIHRVVITGVVSEFGDPFLDQLRDEIDDAVLSTLASKLELCYGRTGDQAVRMGAAALVVSQELGVV